MSRKILIEATYKTEWTEAIEVEIPDLSEIPEDARDTWMETLLYTAAQEHVADPSGAFDCIKLVDWKEVEPDEAVSVEVQS
jgi:hypothetical protein